MDERLIPFPKHNLPVHSSVYESNIINNMPETATQGNSYSFNEDYGFCNRDNPPPQSPQGGSVPRRIPYPG